MDKLRQTIKQEKCYKELTIGRGLKICDPSCLMVKGCAAQKCFLFITFFWIISIDKHCFKRILKYSNGSCVKLQFINTRKFDFLLLSSLIFKLPQNRKARPHYNHKLTGFLSSEGVSIQAKPLQVQISKLENLILIYLFIHFFNLFQFLYSSKPERMSLRHV